ncbi:hypothetical protein EBU95_19210 [bacterium]|nr:hypothetical protein [bacterium]
MPLFSQANPVNTRFKTLNLGTQNVTTDPTGITFFKLKYKSLIRMTDVFNISEYDNLNFSDYLGFYTGYDYNNWLTAKTADGNDIYAYGIVFYDEYGDTIDAVTGDFNPPGTLTVVELSYFYYDIKNVVWGTILSTKSIHKYNLYNKK